MNKTEYTLQDLSKIEDIGIRCDKAMQIVKYMQLYNVTADVANSVVSIQPRFKEKLYE